ncbi:hypothetical protein M9H77_22381 [Catharanthus roseus]|uniref:Uncharacterized protein n=1 Tax=Catharanthus roseus TaxID=4058 RepID=A0ACC0AQ17_CATRO|nr:hypothetical protein M9H77_22381 [Catharanthus roseus]
MQRVPPEMSKRAGRPLAMRRAVEEKYKKPQVKAKVYALDGLPVDIEAEVVEGGVQLKFFPLLSVITFLLHKDYSTRYAFSTMEGVARAVLRQTSHHALRWDSRLVESDEGLEIKVGLRGNLSFLEPYAMSILSIFSLLVLLWFWDL